MKVRTRLLKGFRCERMTCIQSLENKPSSMFWTALARSLEKHIRDSIKGEWFRPFIAYLSPTIKARFNIYAANAKHQLSQAFETLLRIFCSNHSTYRYYLHSKLSKVCLALMFASVYQTPIVQRLYSSSTHFQPWKHITYRSRR